MILREHEDTFFDGEQEKRCRVITAIHSGIPVHQGGWYYPLPGPVIVPPGYAVKLEKMDLGEVFAIFLFLVKIAVSAEEAWSMMQAEHTRRVFAALTDQFIADVAEIMSDVPVTVEGSNALPG